MTALRKIERWWRRRQVEAGLREEMEFHRESRTADLIARGRTPAEAARLARLEFGSATRYREECRHELGYQPWDEITGDLRFALRGLRRHPGFAAAAITILALAIGANGAFFSLYSSYALRPLPIRGVDRHVTLAGLDAAGRSTYAWSPAEREALLQTGIAEGLYAADTFQVLVLAPTQRQSLITAVSGNYFPLLGGVAARGRALTAADDREPVAVLSPTGAARFFPGVADPLGQRLRVRTLVFTVIGVMPAAFTGTEAVIPDFWVPEGMENLLRGRPATEENRQHLAGLLAPGVTAERAEAALSAAAKRFPRPGGEPVARVEVRHQASTLPDAPELQTAAALVFAAFWLVLLIACANLANLYLARAAARTGEIAMRLSLGASRWRIVRQLLTESAFTALLGAAAGCLLAALTVQRAHEYAVSLSGMAGIHMLPVAADWRVVLYSASLGLAAALAFGLLPALEITTPSLIQSARREHGAFGGRLRPRRLRDLLLGGQVAASLVLLILAAVLIRNIQRLEAVDTGYDLDRVADLRLRQPEASALGRLARLPGVAAVSAVERVPLHGRGPRQPVTVGPRTLRLVYNRVDSHYFETLALPVEGRAFTLAEADRRARVVILSRATARELSPGAPAVGQPLRLEDGVYTVIGIVPDVVSGWLFEGPDPSQLYLPGAAGQEGMESALARFPAGAANAAPALRQWCASLAEATGCDPASMREISSLQRFPFQIAAGVAGALGALALLLTGLGLYSVASYSVVRRRREIGVHLALGASGPQVIRRILGEAARCVAWGVAVGLPVCLALSKLAASSFLQIRTFDPAAYFLVPALLAAVAAAACGEPAWRAIRVDPMRSLREE